MSEGGESSRAQGPHRRQSPQKGACRGTAGGPPVGERMHRQAAPRARVDAARQGFARGPVRAAPNATSVDRGKVRGERLLQERRRRRRPAPLEAHQGACVGGMAAILLARSSSSAHLGEPRRAASERDRFHPGARHAGIAVRTLLQAPDRLYGRSAIHGRAAGRPFLDLGTRRPVGHLREMRGSTQATYVQSKNVGCNAASGDGCLERDA